MVLNTSPAEIYLGLEMQMKKKNVFFFIGSLKKTLPKKNTENFFFKNVFFFKYLFFLLKGYLFYC